MNCDAAVKFVAFLSASVCVSDFPAFFCFRSLVDVVRRAVKFRNGFCFCFWAQIFRKRMLKVKTIGQMTLFTFFIFSTMLFFFLVTLNAILTLTYLIITLQRFFFFF